MGDVVRFPLRKAKQVQTYGIRVEIFAPWEAESPEQALESIERVLDSRLGDFFPEGSFQIDVCGPDDGKPSEK